MTANPSLDPRPALPDPYFQSEDSRFRLYQGDCLELMPRMPEAAFDLVFADPPYFLSNGGITCHAGKMVSVHKGKWDESKGAEADHEFTVRWLRECQRLLKPNGSIWVSGTAHIIHSVGYAMQQLGFKLLNDITWVKPNPPPNLSCRYFTHATETIIWAGRDKKCRHKFNYALMRRLNGGKQMLSVWTLEAPRREEKVFGKHPTQKSLALLERIIAASTDENDLVLDPFSGSGTTGIAAARLGRSFAGVEMDEPFLRVAAARLLGVPQADSPERILATVMAHADGVRSPALLGEMLGVTERQVHYCRQAAVMLGLLSFGAAGWQLTDTGQTMAGGKPLECARALAAIIACHPLVQLAVSKVRHCKDSEGRRNTVARLLFASTALSENTCQRRAQTLLAWIAWAKAQLAGEEEYLFRDVPPATEESDDAAVA
jgi:site-specific DNA-methyltransferase (adenine-specific)